MEVRNPRPTILSYYTHIGPTFGSIRFLIYYLVCTKELLHAEYFLGNLCHKGVSLLPR